jgi:hypothetical protein
MGILKYLINRLKNWEKKLQYNALCVNQKERYMIRMTLLLLMLMVLTGCTNFALFTSGAGIAISHNAYVKMYNGIDLMTIVKTEKDIKTHLYESIKYDDK